ncbi:MAG TPA: hypothetical protein VFV10_09875 [Gammaproteobacteria bacterium]|nr:hypothetical protein [Gammaproteobacteria bacterium]
MRLQIVFICVIALGGSAPACAGRARDLPASHFFQTSDHCIACHSNLHSAAGEDVSIGYNWRATIMANSSRDPYWQAGVRRAVIDHPTAQAAIEDTCSTCHMPMARFEAAAQGAQGKVFANLAPAAGAASNPFAIDGVSCTVCHQIQPENFGQHASFDGGFVLDKTTPIGERHIFGPNPVDAGRQSVMRSAAAFEPDESSHVQRSELCATCHTLYTEALDEAGERIGQLPEQMPYLEWRNSRYRDAQSCQSCHMPLVAGEMRAASVLGEPRSHFSQHVFRGGNAFVLGLINSHRGELEAAALPQELDAEIARTVEFLGTETARVSVQSPRRQGGRLAFDVDVENLSGHKFPTAYPSRRAWLHVKVSDAAGTTLFESGALEADGSVAGNDNDADGGRFEPHYDEIRSADQVQIYEPIMVDPEGRVTTDLLAAVRYAKDNRLLPKGFDKSKVPDDVAVRGAAREDANFVGGGDRVRYAVELPKSGSGPLRVDVSLMFQPIGRRWAENLRPYDSMETRRFVAYYDEAARSSAYLVAHASAEIP